MALVFSLPGQPRGRGRIERFFGTVNQLFLCSVPGYSPAGGPAQAPSITLAAFEARWREWLLAEYQQRVHSETHMTPHARWEAGAFLPRLPDSLEQLDLLLLTVATSRHVQQDGIRFQGFRYIDVNLAAYVGEQVTLRYDPRDMAEVRVYHHDIFLCRAICQELAGQTVTLKDIVQARRARRRALRATLTTHAAVVERFLAVHQPEPAVAAPPPPPTPRLKRYVND
jgi:putative transposase